VVPLETTVGVPAVVAVAVAVGAVTGTPLAATISLMLVSLLAVELGTLVALLTCIVVAGAGAGAGVKCALISACWGTGFCCCRIVQRKSTIVMNSTIHQNSKLVAFVLSHNNAATI